MNSEIKLEWIQKVFVPSTRERANGRPRNLISDGFETQESLGVLKFCLESNIVPCRLSSHTSHKLQPCDVSVFGPLKTAYREQVEHLERRGANAVNKEHFVLLYSMMVGYSAPCVCSFVPPPLIAINRRHGGFC